MRTLALTYVISCLLCPLVAFEPHVCKEVIKPTPVHVMLFSSQQKKLMFEELNK